MIGAESFLAQKDSILSGDPGLTRILRSGVAIPDIYRKQRYLRIDQIRCLGSQ